MLFSKSQAAIEYMTVVLIALFAILAFLAIYYGSPAMTRESRKIRIMELTISKIKENANYVWYLYNGSFVEFNIVIPKNIICNRTFIETAGNRTYIVLYSNDYSISTALSYPMYGMLPCIYGTYKVKILKINNSLFFAVEGIVIPQVISSNYLWIANIGNESKEVCFLSTDLAFESSCIDLLPGDKITINVSGEGYAKVFINGTEVGVLKKIG